MLSKIIRTSRKTSSLLNLMRRMGQYLMRIRACSKLLSPHLNLAEMSHPNPSPSTILPARGVLTIPHLFKATTVLPIVSVKAFPVMEALLSSTTPRWMLMKTKAISRRRPSKLTEPLEGLTFQHRQAKIKFSQILLITMLTPKLWQ